MRKNQKTCISPIPNEMNKNTYDFVVINDLYSRPIYSKKNYRHSTMITENVHLFYTYFSDIVNQYIPEHYQNEAEGLDKDKVFS